MLSLHRYFEIKFEGDSGEEVALWRLYLFSRWLVAKFKSPCKSFEVLIHRINETHISDNRKVQQRAATDHDI
jgi:hypothetical protein